MPQGKGRRQVSVGEQRGEAGEGGRGAVEGMRDQARGALGAQVRGEQV